MSEENKNEFENNAENDTIDNIQEDSAVTEVETTEVMSDDAVDEANTVIEDVEADVVGGADAIEGVDAIEGEVISGAEVVEEKKSKNGLIIGAVVAVLVIAAAIIIAVLFGKNLFNKYNRMGYIDVSGRTIAEIADESGYELADFLAEYELPADMPGSTSESAAYYMIPAKNVASMYGMTFEQMKEMLKWGDEITEDTPWGEAEGETAVADYIGTENLDQFKEQYGFGDEVTGETKWKEVRNVLDQKSRDARIEAEKATEAPAEETATVEPAAEEATDAPAESAATDAPAATAAAQ